MAKQGPINCSEKAEVESKTFLAELKRRNPHENEFHQAVEDFTRSIMPLYLDRSDFREANLLERLTEPDRTISFRVCWEDDDKKIHTNRAWRVQFNHALGPYKGGLRFHPSVNLSVLKFLGFEQTIKNSLTGLPLGGSKGGSNFDPKGRSNQEIMRFCQSLMTELHRHIGSDIDVPAGDIGVGAREISYLFGHYLRIANRWDGVLTGKVAAFGGSEVRKEATGYGCVYFCDQMLGHHGKELKSQRVAISGSGNVALYAAQMALRRGAVVVTLSDSNGTIFAKDGLREEQLDGIAVLKERRRGRLAEFLEYNDSTALQYFPDKTPWHLPCDIAMPCATQNEIDEHDAKTLIANGIVAVCEGANMPVSGPAERIFEASKILHAPGKAANAGGVAVSGLEQTQNAMRLSWTREEVDEKLQAIMESIHARCVEHGQSENGQLVNYSKGANIAGFLKVAEAMIAYGVY